MKNKTALIILDGWGIGDGSNSDAITKAKTPYMDSLLNSYPNTQLKTFGEHVGLPNGQMGNSEVGHLNIGAGKIVYQDLLRINNAIANGSFYENKEIVQAMQKAKEKGGNFHLMGLVSKGGVHAHSNHFKALINLAEKQGLHQVYIHAFTDGRDTDPYSGKTFLNNLEEYCKGKRAKIVSVVGRYYAMDRDKRWERTEKAYNLLIKAEGRKVSSVQEVFEYSYAKKVSDEFIEPHFIGEEGRIQEKDTLMCVNFRTDRPRQIMEVLTQQQVGNMVPLNINALSMTRYDESFKSIKVVFDKDNLTNTLGKVLEQHQKTQVRAAETEKYPHVTFFFSGGREEPFIGETRVLQASPKVATYDLMPEMSAKPLTEKVIKKLKEEKPDFLCLNYANTDMVGHTGVYNAILKAANTVDTCLAQVVQTALNLNYDLLVIADHGNADYALNPDGSPNTAHSLNLVPCILVSKQKKELKNQGILADVAPTILELMNLEKPAEMSGESLIKE